MAGNTTSPGRTVASKAIALILIFREGRQYSLTDMARLAGLPLSTTYRLATELAAAGILHRSDQGLFHAGPCLQSINELAVPAPTPAGEKARWLIDDLAAAVPNATVRLGVLRDLEVRYVERPPGTRPAPSLAHCSTAPAHASAMGKALLAFSPPELARQIIHRGLTRHTPFTQTSPKQFLHILATTRMTGAAICERELNRTSWAVAVPVLGLDGNALAALELDTSNPGRQLHLLKAPLDIAARSLSREICATPPGVKPFQIGPESPADLRPAGLPDPVAQIGYFRIPAPR